MFSAKIVEPTHSLIPYVIAGRLYISVLLVRVKKDYSYVVHTLTKNLIKNIKQCFYFIHILR